MKRNLCFVTLSAFGILAASGCGGGTNTKSADVAVSPISPDKPPGQRRTNSQSKIRRPARPQGGRGKLLEIAGHALELVLHKWSGPEGGTKVPLATVKSSELDRWDSWAEKVARQAVAQFKEDKNLLEKFGKQWVMAIREHDELLDAFAQQMVSSGLLENHQDLRTAMMSNPTRARAAARVFLNAFAENSEFARQLARSLFDDPEFEQGIVDHLKQKLLSARRGQ